VFFGKTLRQERVANWTWKGYINGAALVHLPDLRASETEFSAAKPVRVNRYLRPRRNFLFQPPQMLHVLKTSPLLFPMPETGGRFSCTISNGAKADRHETKFP
jgi:hypothetical protein